MRRAYFFAPVLLAVSTALVAQTLPKPDLKAIRNSGNVGTPIRDTQLFVGPSIDTGKLVTVTPGHEVTIVETAQNGWLRVFANTDVVEESADEMDTFGIDAKAPPESGWVLAKGIVKKGQPYGASILFGAAVSAEDDASSAHASQRAAQDARLLYKRVAEYFPDSPLAAEAAWRSADIRWQLQAADMRSHPSAHEKENYLREQMQEDEMRKIEKKYPNTKYASLAAWDLIQNKVCGDWQGSTKCPEKEADMYEKYVAAHPDSPKAPQALYNAAWRLAAAADMHDADEEKAKAEGDRAKAKELAEQLRTKYAQSDYSDRGATLLFKLQQGIPVYGSDRD